MDLRKETKYRVLVEREGFAFFVDLDYKNLLDYYNFCNWIGHNQSYCKKANPQPVETLDRAAKKIKGILKAFVAKEDNKTLDKETVKEVSHEPILHLANLDIEQAAGSSRTHNDHDSEDSEFVDATLVVNEGNHIETEGNT